MDKLNLKHKSSKLMRQSKSIEELFNLEKGAGGLHNMLDVHTVFIDEQGRVSVDLRLTEELLNPHGKAHGGTVFALCDIAAGSFVALNKMQCVTLDSSIHFYRPGLPDTVLTAVVNERKRGRTTSVFLVEVWDNNKKHIADAIFTMHFIGRA